MSPFNSGVDSTRSWARTAAGDCELLRDAMSGVRRGREEAGGRGGEKDEWRVVVNKSFVDFELNLSNAVTLEVRRVKEGSRL